mgnify:CR=1 FL=1|jgi:hypothetical protein
MMNRVQLLLYWCCIYLLFNTYKVAASDACVEGLCEECTSDEAGKDYCATTGRKIQVTCGSDKSYQSCDSTPGDEQMQVLVFQIVMAIIGGLAYWGVQIKKTKNLSLFDTRKRAARSGLAT